MSRDTALGCVSLQISRAKCGLWPVACGLWPVASCLAHQQLGGLAY